MRLTIDTTAQELRTKAPELISELAKAIQPVDAELADILQKALPPKEQELKYPVLRTLYKMTQGAYEAQRQKMLKEIEGVLSVSITKSLTGDSEDLVKGLFIGPKGGRWADAKHTIPYKEPVAHTVKVHHKIHGGKAKEGSQEHTYHEVAEKEGKVKLSRHGPEGHGPWMPKESVAHFKRDLAGKVEGPASKNADIQAVLDAKAIFLGKGDDGLAFKVGSKVVKVSTTVPFQPENPGHRSPKEAVAMLRKQSEVGNKLADMGVPGIQRSEFLEHGDKGFQIKDWVEIPEKFTREQLDKVQDTLIAMHEKGYVLRDAVQAGLDVKTGQPVMFDVGKAAPRDSKTEPNDRMSPEQSDRDRMQQLYREHGHDYVRRDFSEGQQAWGQVEDKLFDLMDNPKFGIHLAKIAKDKLVKEAKAVHKGKDLEKRLQQIEADTKGAFEMFQEELDAQVKKALSEEEVRAIAKPMADKIREAAKKVYDHTKPIADKDDVAYTRVKAVLTQYGYTEEDYLKGGPLYGQSVNQLRELIKEKRDATHS